MIKIVNLQKRFKKRAGREDFLLDIQSLLIQENEIVYFVGPNGSGKTVLLSLIQGEIDCDSGEVDIIQNDLDRKINLLSLEPFKRSKFLGFIPQESDEALINEMNMIEHVLVGLNRVEKLSWFFPRPRNLLKVKKAVEQFGMGFENRLYEPVGNLSGGERQVLAFCLATLNKPLMLLLDEFTSALDPEMAEKVLKLVISFIRESKLSAIIVTHRHKEAIQNADRIIILHKGKPFRELKRNDPDFNEIALKNIFSQLYNTTLIST